MQKLEVHNLIAHMLEHLNNVTAEKQSAIGMLLCLVAVKKVYKDVRDYDPITISSLQNFKQWLPKKFENHNQETICALLRLLDIGVLNDELFCSFVKDVLKSSYNEDDLKQITECLIDEILLEQYNPTIKTPKWLNRLAIVLAGTNEGIFYDGTAGAGDTALGAYRHAKKAGGNLKIFTQEINRFFSDVIAVRMFIEGVVDGKHICGNSIAKPMFPVGSEGADLSIMFPPLGIANNFDPLQLQALQAAFPTINISKLPSEWCFALHQIASLAPHGKAVICLSNGALSNVSGAQVRAEIMKSGILECVISLPPNSFPFSSAAVNLLVFNKNQKHAQVLMMDAEQLMETRTVVSNKKRFVLSESAIKALQDIYESKKEVAHISKLINAENLMDATLSPEKYVRQSLVSATQFGAIEINLAIQNNIFTSEWRRLNEVAELTIGMNNSKFAKPAADGDVKIIKLSDVNNGMLHIENVERYDFFQKNNFEKYQIEKNDILISCKGAAVKVCSVEHIEKNVFISSNFFRVRVNPTILHPLYLKYYLESPLGQYFVKSKQSGSVITTINSAEIASLPIYYIPLEKQIALVSKLQKEEEEINEKIAQLAVQLNKNRWNYYQAIGITKFMNRNEEE